MVDRKSFHGTVLSPIYYSVFRQENVSLKVGQCMESEIGPFNTPKYMETTGGL